MFTEREVDMLTLATKHPDEYRIIVDNDSIWLERMIDEDSDEDCFVDNFNTFGCEFAYELLKHIGCNVEYR